LKNSSLKGGDSSASFPIFQVVYEYFRNKAVHHPLFHPAAEGDPASEADLVFSI